MTKLFVVGFPREMGEMQLAALFGPHGDIQLLTIVRDQLTGMSKGFGFIQMDDQGALDAIAALNGMKIEERLLEVRVAEEKAEPLKPVFVKKASAYIPVRTQTPVKKKRPRISK